MNRTEKQTNVDALTAKLAEARAIYVTDYQGLTVGRVTDLRRRLRKAGVDYVVVKNTLALRALQAASVPGLDGHVRGPTAFALSQGDAAAAAKVLTDFAKEFEKPALKAAIVDGRAVSPEQVRRMAQLPPRDVLLSQVAGTLQAPLAGFVGALTGLLSTFVGAVEALRAQRENAA
jgi:large subunit ribosomal protein L10